MFFRRRRGEDSVSDCIQEETRRIQGNNGACVNLDMYQLERRGLLLFINGSSTLIVKVLAWLGVKRDADAALLSSSSAATAHYVALTILSCEGMSEENE